MNTQQLEARSDAERAEMENTIGELRQRLSPGQLLDEVLAHTKDGGGAFLSSLGRQATANPLPVTLIGAGLAWFLFSKHDEQNASSSASQQADGAASRSMASQYADRAAQAGSEGIDDVSGMMSGASDRIGNGIDQAKGMVSDAGQRVADGVSRAGEVASNASERITSSVTQGAAAVGSAARSAAASGKAIAGDSLAFLKDQPLVLLGAGLALGAAIGASIPTTEAEDKLMGEASDQLKSKAGKMAGEQLDTVKRSGEHLYSEAAQSIKREIEGIAGKSTH